MLQGSAEFEFELPQGFDDLGFEQRRGRGVAFHRAIRETLELVDHLIETPGVDAALAPVAPQVLRFAQTFANLGGKLAVVAPVAADRALRIEAAALAVTVRLRAVLRTAGLLGPLLLPLFRSLALLTLLPALTLFATLGLLAALGLFTMTLLPLLPLLTALQLLTVAVASRVLVQTSPQRIETVGELARAIEIFFSARTVWTTRALFCRLQTFRDIIQAAFDRAFITARRTLLTTTSSVLLSGLPLLSAAGAAAGLVAPLTTGAGVVLVKDLEPGSACTPRPWSSPSSPAS